MAWGSTLSPQPQLLAPNDAFPTVSNLLVPRINRNNGFSGDLKANSYKRLKDAAIAALLKYPKVKDACEAVGIDYQTLNRWRKKPDFIVAFNRAKKELVQAASVRAQEQALSMMDVLVEVAQDKANSEMARVAAAKTLIDYSIRFQMAEDIEARLEALEKQTTAYEPNGIEGQNSEAREASWPESNDSD